MLKVIIYLVVGVIIAVVGSLLAALVAGEGRSLRKESSRHHGLTRLVLVCGFFLFGLVAVALLLSYWISLWFLLPLLPIGILFVGIALLSDPNDPSVGSKNRFVTREDYLGIKARLRDK
jgi:MFS family permease